MSYLYNTFIYQPLLNGLVFLYQTVAFEDLGIAIILLTIAIRLILFPIFQKGVRQQAVMQELQPKLKKIQQDHKNDKERQVKATLELYRSHKINPLSGFLLILVQLPILFALYRIFLNSFSPESFSGKLYGFISSPDHINNSLLGLINLNERSIVLVGLAAAAQYFQGKLALSKQQASGQPTAVERMSKNMVFLAPVLTLIFFYNLPAAVSLYWLTASAFSIFQQKIINHQRDNGKLGNIPQKNA